MNNDNNYVVFKLSEGYGFDKDLKWRTRYFCRRGLIRYLAVNVLYDKSSIIDNVVNKMGIAYANRRYVPDKDSWFGYKAVLEYKYYLARQVGDSLVAVTLKSLTHEIELEVDAISKHKADIAKEMAAKRRCEAYEFRKGPVAYTGKNRYRCKYYRHPQLNQVKRTACKLDKTEFKWNKYREVNLPCWDDRPRHRDKSWKTSYKVKKQWMKHKNKHCYKVEDIKTLVDRDNYPDYYENIVRDELLTLDFEG